MPAVAPRDDFAGGYYPCSAKEQLTTSFQPIAGITGCAPWVVAACALSWTAWTGRSHSWSTGMRCVGGVCSCVTENIQSTILVDLSEQLTPLAWQDLGVWQRLHVQRSGALTYLLLQHTQWHTTLGMWAVQSVTFTRFYIAVFAACAYSRLTTSLGFATKLHACRGCLLLSL